LRDENSQNVHSRWSTIKKTVTVVTVSSVHGLQFSFG